MSPIQAVIMITELNPPKVKVIPAKTRLGTSPNQRTMLESRAQITQAANRAQNPAMLPAKASSAQNLFQDND